MLIDWFTVIAQLANFLILVWLLKRFLYHPVLEAIDAREQKIAAELAAAAARMTAANTERAAYQLKNEELERQRGTLLLQAQEQAKAERARLLDAARQEADYLAAKRQEALRSEQQNLGDALTRRSKEEVFAIARKVLADLAGATLEQRMTEVFLQRLQALNDADQAELKALFQAARSPLLLRSAFPLPEEQRSSLAAAIRQLLGQDKQLQFETAPAIVSGIELSTDGHKLAWSIAEYLQALEKRVDQLLKT